MNRSRTPASCQRQSWVGSHATRPMPVVVRTFLAASAVHLFAVAPQAGGAQAARPEPLPFPASVESVVERGTIEGHPVSVLRLRSALPVADAIAAVRAAWAGHAAAVLAVRAGPWQVVSRREPAGYRTLQLRASPGGGSEGLLSVWSDDGHTTPARGESALEPASLLPADARVLRSLEGIDGARRHRTVVAIANGSVRWSVDALEARARSLGFVRDPVAGDAGMQRPAHADHAQARLYRRSGQALAVTVHRQGERIGIVVHLTEGGS